ncbi:TPA: hypothetical protein ACO4DY_004119, partial [Escherichia coli]
KTPSYTKSVSWQHHQERVHFSSNQINEININMINEIFDSESGTTIHKASLKSGAFSFSGYGKFLAVATCYLRAVFLAIFTDVCCFIHTNTCRRSQ